MSFMCDMVQGTMQGEYKMDGVFAIPRFRRARAKCAWGTRSNALLMSKQQGAPRDGGTGLTSLPVANFNACAADFVAMCTKTSCSADRTGGTLLYAVGWFSHKLLLLLLVCLSCC